MTARTSVSRAITGEPGSEASQALGFIALRGVGERWSMSSIAPLLSCKAARARTPELRSVHDLGIQRLVVPLVVPTDVDGEPASVAVECHFLTPTEQCSSAEALNVPSEACYDPQDPTARRTQPPPSDHPISLVKYR
jgi:hypothetical protein